MATDEEPKKGDDLLKREEQAKHRCHHGALWCLMVNSYSSCVVFSTHLISVRLMLTVMRVR